MILRGLRLKNIRSYREAEIEFPKGTILISGDIGSGKSTILLAIEFALFGIRRTELSGESLLRYGKASGEVELNFTIGNKEISILRTLKKQKNSVAQDSGTLVVNGYRSNLTAVELKSKVLELLGYPMSLLTKSKSQIYRYTVYTPQERMKQILFEDKDIRLNTLRRVFGVDKYKRIRENSLIYLRELRKNIQELGQKTGHLDNMKKEHEIMQKSHERFQSDIDEIEQNLTVLRNELKAAREKIRLSEHNLKQLENLEKEVAALMAQDAEKRHNLTNYKDEIVKLREKIEEISRKLEPYKDIAEPDDEASLEKNLSEAQEFYLEINTRISVCNEKIANFRKRESELGKSISSMTDRTEELMKLNARISDLESKIEHKPRFIEKLEAIEKRLNAALMQQGKLEGSIGNSEQIINDVNSLSTCPLCRQEVTLDHKRDVISKEKLLIRQIKEKLKALSDVIKDLSSKRDTLSHNIELINEIEMSIVKLEGERKAIEITTKSLVDNKKEHSTVVADLKELEEIIKKENQALMQQDAKLSRLKNELKIARGKNLKLREKQNLSGLKDKYRIDLEKVQDEIKESEKVIEETSMKIDQKRITVHSLGNVHETHERLKQELESIQSSEKELEIRRAECNSKKESIQKEVEKSEKEIAELEKCMAQKDRNKRILYWFEDHFLPLINLMERHVMLSIYNEFNSTLQEWFSILIEDMEIRLDEEFTPQLMQNGHDILFENLSGGEKTSVSLAYRLALNKVINDLIATIKTRDLIILDEPTDGFSTEQLDRVRDVFAELDMGQIIIVSHEQKMESFVENIIKIQKKDHQSFISKHE